MCALKVSGVTKVVFDYCRYKHMHLKIVVQNALCVTLCTALFRSLMLYTSCKSASMISFLVTKPFIATNQSKIQRVHAHPITIINIEVRYPAN